MNDQLEILLTQKLIYQVVRGRTTESLHDHRRRLVEELSRWILPCEKTPETYDSTFRDQLITILASGSKNQCTEIPLEESEWLKLTNQWVRNNSSDDMVFPRDIYAVLAVDGFYGFRPKDLKHYLSKILVPLRMEFRTHASGVRAMYAFFDDHESVASLTGTDSACIVFLALLRFYAGELQREMLDDHVALQVQRAQSLAEGYLHKHSEYYRDVRNVDEVMLKTLASVYSEQFVDRMHWEMVGKELFKLLMTFSGQKVQ